MKRAAIIVFLSALAACSSQPERSSDPYAAARREARLADDECHAEHLASGTASALDEARCVKHRVPPIFRAANYPYMDLVNLYMAAKETAARKIDNGSVEPAEARQQLQRLSRRISGEEKRRLSGGAAKRAPSLLAGLDALSMKARTHKARPRRAEERTEDETPASHDRSPAGEAADRGTEAEPAEGTAPSPAARGPARRPNGADDGFHGSL
jgi:hypothetical protein